MQVITVNFDTDLSSSTLNRFSLDSRPDHERPSTTGVGENADNGASRRWSKAHLFLGCITLSLAAGDRSWRCSALISV